MCIIFELNVHKMTKKKFSNIIRWSNFEEGESMLFWVRILPAFGSLSSVIAFFGWGTFYQKASKKTRRWRKLRESEKNLLLRSLLSRSALASEHFLRERFHRNVSQKVRKGWNWKESEKIITTGLLILKGPYSFSLDFNSFLMIATIFCLVYIFMQN